MKHDILIALALAFPVPADVLPDTPALPGGRPGLPGPSRPDRADAVRPGPAVTQGLALAAGRGRRAYRWRTVDVLAYLGRTPGLTPALHDVTAATTDDDSAAPDPGGVASPRSGRITKR
jgi:hypothetical protein